MRPFRASLVLLVLLLAASPVLGEEYVPVNGDIVFQTLPTGPLVQAIEIVSQSHFSHCGLVVERKEGFFVLEAMGNVHFTPLKEWVAQGVDSKLEVYRTTKLSSVEMGVFTSAAEEFMDLPYDYHYKMDDEAIYCSELVYKAYKAVTGKDLGTPQKLGDLNWKAAAVFIMVWELGGVPLERVIITPVALTRTPLVRKIYSNYPLK